MDLRHYSCHSKRIHARVILCGEKAQLESSTFVPTEFLFVDLGPLIQQASFPSKFCATNMGQARRKRDSNRQMVEPSGTSPEIEKVYKFGRRTFKAKPPQPQFSGTNGSSSYIGSPMARHRPWALRNRATKLYP